MTNALKSRATSTVLAIFLGVSVAAVAPASAQNYNLIAQPAVASFDDATIVDVNFKYSKHKRFKKFGHRGFRKHHTYGHHGFRHHRSIKKHHAVKHRSRGHHGIVKHKKYGHSSDRDFKKKVILKKLFF